MWFHVLQVPLTPNIENTPTWMCFRCLAASSLHSLMLDTKNTPPRCVLCVQHSPRPIFNAARRVSPLLVMLNTHFDVARRVNTLIVTSKPNPPYLGHGYGFWAGDPNSTRIHTRPTRTCLPARVCKPVMNPSRSHGAGGQYGPSVLRLSDREVVGLLGLR